MNESEQENYIKLEQELLKRLVLTDTLPWQKSLDHLKYVGGVDISFFKEDDTRAIACFTVVDISQKKSDQVKFKAVKQVELTIPYQHGFLGYRESPPLVELIRSSLNTMEEDIKPKVILVDGNGRLHPRGFGLACHIGLELNIPTVGVAKNLSCVGDLTYDALKTGQLQSKGDVQKLFNKENELLGYAYISTEKASKPIFVSVGHLISLDTALDVVKQCCFYRIPEPTRQADMISREEVRRVVEIKS